MNRLSRPIALKIAASLSFVLAVATIATSLPFISLGAAATDPTEFSPPFIVIMIAFITAIVAIVAAYGTWKQQRWGIILTIVANVINGLSAIPGLALAPNTPLLIASLVTIVVTILIIILCLWRSPKVSAV